MFKKIVFSFIGALLILFCFTGCIFDKAFTSSKAGQITIKFGSSARNATLEKIFEDENSFITVNLCGEVEETQTVKAEPGAAVSFKDIPVGSKVYLEAQIYIAQEGRKRIIYKGKTDVLEVVPGPNPAEIRLFSVEEYETQNGGNPPAEEKIEIHINCAEKLMSQGSEIKIYAKDKNGEFIPKTSLIVTVTGHGYMEGADPFEFAAYPESNQGELLELVNSDDNEIILKTVFPESFFPKGVAVSADLVFNVQATADGETKTQSLTRPLIQGVATQNTFIMNPDTNEIRNGDSILFSVKDKDGNNIPNTDIQIKVMQVSVVLKEGKKTTELTTGFTIESEGTYEKKVTVTNLAVAEGMLNDGEMHLYYPYEIQVTVNKNGNEETASFGFKVLRPIIPLTISIEGVNFATTAAQISTKLISTIQQDGILQINFTGNNDYSTLNVYTIVMSQVRTGLDGVSLVSGKKLINLDFSGCTGNALGKINQGIFQNINYIGVLELSDSTTEIAESAFESFEIDNLNLRNVTKVGISAFSGAKIAETFDMPKVTVFGNQCGYGLTAGTMKLGAATEIYKDSGETGNWVFYNSTIEEINAPKLKRIDDGVFGAAYIGYYAIDSLMYVGTNSLKAQTDPAWDYKHILKFESEENAQGWYQCVNEAVINGVSKTINETALGLYQGQENFDWDELISAGCMEAIEPDNVITRMSTNNGGTFVRRPQ